MNGAVKVFTTRNIVMVSTLALVLAGCKAKPATDDASLSTQVQNRITSDSALAGQPIQASVNNGVATLNGSANSEAARVLAGNDAAQVGGVRTVVNNLMVQPGSPAPTTAAVEQPERPTPAPNKSSKPSPAVSRPAPGPVARNNSPAPMPEAQQAQQAPAPVVQQAPPPPPPAPVVHNITVPAGTSIPVRITQTLDSASTQTGDK